MSRAATMKGNSPLALPKPIANDAIVSRHTQAAPWDPFEVWLTRIKQPRDSRAKVARGVTSNGIGDRRD
jgi:hypothetical protein